MSLADELYAKGIPIVADRRERTLTAAIKAAERFSH